MSEDENKKYTVVDKRFADEETTPEPPRGEKPAPPPPEPPPQAPPEAPEEEEFEQPGDGQQRMMTTEEFIALFMNLLRDQAALNLGMPLLPGASQPASGEKTELIVGLSKKIMDKFGARVFANVKSVPDDSMDLAKILLSYLGVLREYILIHMGLLANPVTGLVAKNLDQARLAIDFFALIAEDCGSLFKPEEARALESLLADIRLNFARMSGL